MPNNNFNLFGREYHLTIFRNEEAISRAYSARSIVDAGAINIRTVDDGDFAVVTRTGLEINDLHVTMRTKSGKNKASNVQEAVITIDNLSLQSLAQIQTEDTIMISVGYKSVRERFSTGLATPLTLDTHPLAFVGQISSVVTSGSSTRVTTIEAKSMQAVGKLVKISKVAVAYESRAEVTDYYLNRLAFYGIPTGGVLRNDTDNDYKYPSGYVASGRLWDSFEEFCDSVGLRCYISLGRVYVEPQQLAPILEWKTYIELGLANIKEISSEISPKDFGKAGIRVKIFIDAEVTTNKRVRITEGQYEGEYDISSVGHIFDSMKGDASTVLTLNKLEG